MVKASKYYIPTLREDPADAETISQKIALRGGYIKKVAAGIYDLLPLGVKLIRKVENIIREELNKKEAMEVFMPSMVPAELWEKSGRWHKYGKELLRIKDRAGRDFCYGPTHEEVITDLVTGSIKSYKQLPVNFYQIQTKFRDEIRPRFGLMRAREFTMKDAYSFHANFNSLNDTYNLMFAAYSNIFKRCGLSFRVVNADSGNIGGSASQEFMITANSGEDELLYCSECNYAANIEKASSFLSKTDEQKLPIQIISTPNKKSIQEVCDFLNTVPEKMIKAVAYGTVKFGTESSTNIIVFIRADYEVNETKLLNLLNVDEMFSLDEATLNKEFNIPAGFIGPIGLNTQDERLIFDESILYIDNAVCGANKTNYHYLNCNPQKDFKISKTVDIRKAKPQDICPQCKKGKLIQERGIEVGHIFKLGTKYSESMKATYLDEKGLEQPFVMGCYGIGVGRTAMAAIEQSHDEKGPIFPINIAPFEVIILPANIKDSLIKETAEKMYENFLFLKIDVFFDDRDERFGVKFKDADLIGAPFRVVLGKSITEGKCELNYRNGTKEEILLSEINTLIFEKINQLKGN